MNWDQQRPVKAAAERCQGWASTSPPQGLPAPSLSHTHRPPFSGAHGPAGSWVDFPIPQNSFCMRNAKNGLAGSQPPRWRQSLPRRGGAVPAKRPAAAEPASRSRSGFAPAQALLCPLLSHIPTDRCSAGRTGRRALRWVSQSRKLHFVYGSQKMGSPARSLGTHARWWNGALDFLTNPRCT
jgi:hypothetical protein